MRIVQPDGVRFHRVVPSVDHELESGTGQSPAGDQRTRLEVPSEKHFFDNRILCRAGPVQDRQPGMPIVPAQWTGFDH